MQAPLLIGRLSSCLSFHLGFEDQRQGLKVMPRAMGVREGQKVFKVMIGGWGGSGWGGGWLFASVAHNWAKTMHKCISHYGL